MVQYFIVQYRSEDENGNVPVYISESCDKACDHALFQNLKYCITQKVNLKFVDKYYVCSVEHFDNKNPTLCLCEYAGSSVDNFFDTEELYYDTYNNREYMNLRADFFD